MPKRVIYMRHGIAVDGHEWPGEDASRPLTDEGISKTIAVAEAIASLYDVRATISSDYVRARETAKLVADAFPTARRPLHCGEYVALRPEAEWSTWRRAFVEIVRSQTRKYDGSGESTKKWGSGDDAESAILVVGHEPSIGVLAACHAGLREPIAPMRKAGICVVELHAIDQGMLEAWIPPRVLRRMSKRH